MLQRSPRRRWMRVAAWTAALAGCAALAGYALARPVSGDIRVAAVLDAVALVATAVMAARLLPGRLPVLLRDLGAPAVLAGLLLTRPVRDAVLAGALTPCAVALVLYAVPAPRRWRLDGVALGVAAAIAPPYALFGALPWRAGRRGAAVTGAAIGALVTAARWLLDPPAGGWRILLSGPAPADAAGRIDDVSVNGMLVRLGLSGGPLLACWLLVVGVVVAAASVRAGRYARDGQHLLALGVLGCAVVAATPVAWSYDLLWLLAAGAGRLGRRAEDRPVWPILAVLPALFTSALFDPGAEPVSSYLLRNSPGLVGLLAAAALRFRLRADPSWRAQRRPATAGGHPFGRRWLPLLPPWLRSVRRPNLLLELLFIQLGYGVYSWIRNAAPDRARLAVGHGQDVLRVERLLHVDLERTVNRWMLARDWLTDFLEQYYKTLHFAVPLAILAWLYWRHPERYRPARTVLFATTGLALIGFWAYPLAPPRLTPGHGFRDSLRPGGNTDPLGAFTALANQFAAMPSLHIGWSTWSALVLATTAPYLWVRIIGALYPVTTFVVVLGTANHWVLDAAGALAAVALACLLQNLLTGRRLRDPENGFSRRRPAPVAAGPPPGAATSPGPR